MMGGGFPNAVITFISSAQQAATTSATKTVSTSIGTASADRYVIVYGTFANTQLTPRTISSATINGVAATIAQNIASTTATASIGCFFALVPTGTGAVTITANMSGTTVSSVSSFHVYTVTGRTTLTATAAVDSGAGAGVSTRSTITTPPVYGFAVHQWGGLTVPTTPTWSSTIGTPTITGVGTASTTYVSVTDTTSANGGVSVTTTFTSVNNTSCRMNSVSFSYI